MPTADLSGDDLLRAAEQLSPPEFDRFFTHLLALRATRAAPRLSAPEAALLQQINAGLPGPLRLHYESLVARRDARTLSPAEQEELSRLSDEVEAIEAARVASLAELAVLRGVTLTALMADLGIPSRDHG